MGTAPGARRSHVVDAAPEGETAVESETLSRSSHDWVRYTWRLDRIGAQPALPAGYEIVTDPEPDEDSVLSVVFDAYASDPTWLVEMPAIRARMRRRVHESLGREGVVYVTARRAGALVAVSGVAARHWTGQNLITGICVDPSHQRLGLGSALLGASLEWLRDSCALSEAIVYTELGSLADRKLYPLFGGHRERDVTYPGANDTGQHAGGHRAHPAVPTPNTGACLSDPP